MAGFGEEFEKIYMRYFNDVFLFLKKLSKDESIAEEITSETFFKAMLKMFANKFACIHTYHIFYI